MSREVVGVMAPIDRDRFPHSVPSHRGVEFWVGDADATAAQSQALGGTVLVAPHDEGMFRRAVLADPPGATFSTSKFMI